MRLLKTRGQDIDQLLIKNFKSNTHCMYLNSNQTGSNLFAAKKKEHECGTTGINDFSNRKIFNKGSWYFGYLGYNLKNSFEKLTSAHHAKFKFEDYKFWEPEIVVKTDDKNWSVLAGNEQQLFMDTAYDSDLLNDNMKSFKLVPRTSREDYFENFKRIQWHIQRGDIYELNYCVEWYAEGVQIDPIETYLKLNGKTNAPFSCLLKSKDQYLICASPERFLKKRVRALFHNPSRELPGDRLILNWMPFIKMHSQIISRSGQKM